LTETTPVSRRQVVEFGEGGHGPPRAVVELDKGIVQRGADLGAPQKLAACSAEDLEPPAGVVETDRLRSSVAVQVKGRVAEAGKRVLGVDSREGKADRGGRSVVGGERGLQEAPGVGPFGERHAEDAAPDRSVDDQVVAVESHGKERGYAGIQVAPEGDGFRRLRGGFLPHGDVDVDEVAAGNAAAGIERVVDHLEPLEPEARTGLDQVAVPVENEAPGPGEGRAGSAVHGEKAVSLDGHVAFGSGVVADVPLAVVHDHAPDGDAEADLLGVAAALFLSRRRGRALRLAHQLLEVHARFLETRGVGVRDVVAHHVQERLVTLDSADSG